MNYPEEVIIQDSIDELQERIIEIEKISQSHLEKIEALEEDIQYLNEREQEDYDEIRSNVSYKNWYATKLEKRMNALESDLDKLIEWKEKVQYVDCELEGDKITFKRTDGRSPGECPFCGTNIDPEE